MRRAAAAWGTMILALAALGCSVPEGRFGCTRDDACPGGQVCRADHLCWRTPDGADAAGADAGTSDAGTGPVDAGTSDGSAFDAGPRLDTGPRPDAGPPVGCPRAIPAGGVCDDAISAGYSTCALRPGGGVRCWGLDGPNDALGDGATHPACNPASSGDCSPSPVTVNGVATAQSVASGDGINCARLADATVACWGTNVLGTGPLPGPTVIAHSDGASYVGVRAPLAILRPELRVGGTDLQGSGVFGTGTFPAAGATRALPTSSLLLGGVAPIAMDVGWSHLCAISSAFDVYCWGRNASQQLGTGSDAALAVPTAILPSGNHFLQVATGDAFTCGLSMNGHVLCWGANGDGQLGRGGLGGAGTPVELEAQIAEISSVVEIEAGLAFACARESDGTVWCWGSDEHGQLGDVATHAVCATSACSPTATQVGLPTAAIDVAAGNAHACALLESGEIWCWGHNGLGQLGDGTLIDRATPVAVVGLD